MGQALNVELSQYPRDTYDRVTIFLSPTGEEV